MEEAKSNCEMEMSLHTHGNLALCTNSLKPDPASEKTKSKKDPHVNVVQFMNPYFLINVHVFYLFLSSQDHGNTLKCNLRKDYCFIFHVQSTIHMQFLCYVK